MMPVPDVHTEKALLIALKNSDQAAFEQLYHRYKRPIYYNLHKLVHLREVAEELTQDTFLKVWQQRRILDVEKSFQAFLRRIAGNLAVDFYRRAAQDKKLREHLLNFATEHYDPVEIHMNLRENHTAIHVAMEKLPPRRREVFALCKLEGKSYAEAAQLLGISAGTVNDHIVKATKFLREELLRNNPDFCRLLLLIAFSF